MPFDKQFSNGSRESFEISKINACNPMITGVRCFETAPSLFQVIETLIEQSQSLILRDRPADQISLHILAVTLTKIVVLRFGLIKFSSNAEQDATGPGDPQNILKVTIKNNLGETLTCLFSE